LSGDGDVMIINGDQRFFGVSSGMVPVSSSAGRSYLLTLLAAVAVIPGENQHDR